MSSSSQILIDLNQIGFKRPEKFHHNLSYDEIFLREKENTETIFTESGCMSVDTGIYTGRSPKDKYFVEEDSSKNHIWWGNINKPISEDIYRDLYGECVKYLDGKELYVFDGFAGARKSTRMGIRVITEKAWQHHFCTNMFIRPNEEDLKNFIPDFTIINASGFKNTNYLKHKMNSETFIIFNLKEKKAIIGGTEYGGEMKKGIFSVMNYYMPLKGILTMHCSANRGKENNDTALFFGLSGTGKTTLSTDHTRPIIGDDEHGWDDEGIWNLEGGCYAKVINLSRENEPEIYNAIRKNALLENVTISNGSVNYESSKKTENTRVSYPIFHLENRVEGGVSEHPKDIIFLTCDAFGVLPAVSRLSPEQAVYHFITGYTAKIAGTERGVNEPVAAFSACYGAAFLPLHPVKYAALLREKIKKHNCRAWLVNTGWSGGPVGTGKRMSIKITRNLLHSIFCGEFDHDDYTKDEIMNLSIPNYSKNFREDVLHPWNSWENQDEYNEARLKLANMFVNNFLHCSPGSDFKYESFGPKIP